MRNSFTLTYILLTVGQMILSNYFHFTPYVMLTILPAMVLCIPTKTGTVKAMLIAFVTGLAVDFFAEGTLGINALSLVPVALLRKPVIDLFFGSEPFEQKENISVRIWLRQGLHGRHADDHAFPDNLHIGRLRRHKTVLVHSHKGRALHRRRLPGLDLHHQPSGL